MEQIYDSLRLQIMQLEHSLLDCSWTGKAINNEFTRLYCIQAGAGTVIRNGVRTTLRPGYLYVFPPCETFEHSCPHVLELHWAHLRAQIWGSLEIFESLPLPVGVKLEDFEQHLQLWKAAVELFPEPDALSAIQLDTMVRQILIRLMSCVEPEVHERLSQTYSRFKRILHRIDTHLHTPLRLTELSAEMQLQPAYFSHLFKRTFGFGLRSYILQKRIERAQTMLRFGDASLEQISTELGFGDAFHFSKTFKQRTGMSPSAYRRQNKLDP